MKSIIIQQNISEGGQPMVIYNLPYNKIESHDIKYYNLNKDEDICKVIKLSLRKNSPIAWIGDKIKEMIKNL